MKSTVSTIAVTLIFLIISTPADAQEILKKLGKRAAQAAERTVERRVERETEKKTDEALDKVFEPGKKSGNEAKSEGKNGNAGAAGTADGDEADAGEGRTFAAYSKFDFIPGERVIAVEDFSPDAIGDFPARWNTNASGEIMTIEGREGKWLALTSKGAFTPEFVTDLPENFTLEFDLAVTPGYSFYNQPLMITMAALPDKNSFTAWSRFGRDKRTGVIVTLHPQDAGSAPRGQSGYEIWVNGNKAMTNHLTALSAFNNKDRNIVRVSIWRQKQRMRLYVDETKVWDLPRAFDTEAKYNGIVFSRDDAKDGEQYFISNIRLAVGAPDTRSKLITEGRFSTTGIYFNSGSAVIKPESYGVLKSIAAVLQENPDVSVRIIGHTDSDGSDDLNLRLSKERANAVKRALQTEFGIDADRMETDGKGESEPVGDNATPEGKAQNRRVEFIKLP